MSCTFPLCKVPEYREGFCIFHAKHFASKKVKAALKPIPAKSQKRIAEDKVYKKVVAEMMAANNKCMVKSPVCSGTASGLHHMQKRCGKNITDKNNLVACCTPCNGFIETSPTHPISKKFSISRFKN